MINPWTRSQSQRCLYANCVFPNLVSSFVRRSEADAEGDGERTMSSGMGLEGMIGTKSSLPKVLYFFVRLCQSYQRWIVY